MGRWMRCHGWSWSDERLRRRHSPPVRCSSRAAARHPAGRPRRYQPARRDRGPRRRRAHPDRCPQPHPDRPELLRVLRDKHGELTTHLLTRAYLPHPDEATTLGIPEATPVLETTWLTPDPGGYTVLAAIERANADGVHYAFRSALS